MKSGAGDPFADDDFDEDDDEGIEAGVEADTTEHSRSTTVDESDDSASSDLPYKYRRDTVQDDRAHANLFLRDKAEDHVETVVERMEDTFAGETVSKIDVLEAIVLAADEPARTVEDELRKMGYGMK